jgi:hypothetical protein
MKITQLLVHMGFYAKSLNNREMTAALNKLLTVTMGIDAAHVVHFQHDRAEAVLLAVDSLMKIFPVSARGGCLSHTLNHCGENIRIATAVVFFTAFNGILATSKAAKTAWCRLTGKNAATKSATRWWSEYECCAFLLQNIDHLPAFLETAELQKGEFMKTMRTLWKDAAVQRAITFELTCLVTVGKQFVTATYTLEGDGAVAFTAYDVIQSVEQMRKTQFEDMEFGPIQELAKKYGADKRSPPTPASQVMIL